ncbi:DegT/DnrJ/EryC1/StrS family aminotransferase [Arcticibacter sp.]|uniref:DegT/DnrJ/EryC1/StrS family aminotransferase n=1 Tax=Arcticibacter sp. TaxID=1872630 RepID=UPI00389009F6
MNIPFSPPYIDEAVINEVIDTLQSKWITTGPKVKALECEVVKLTGTKAAVCVNSWTSGAILMLKWFGVKEGDEVIMPAYTYSATALCVLNCGATPVMVDISDDLTIDVDKIKQAITSKTKVIIPVDIAGWPCDYNAIMAVINDPEVINIFKPESANQSKLGRILLISDAAHSIGAVYEGKSASVKADVSIFSFHAVKNITTAEGGCICLNLPEDFDNELVYDFLKIYSLNGQNRDAYSKSRAGNWKYDILFQGLKFNMPDICAAIGLAQIRQYQRKLLSSRKEIAYKYFSAFKAFNWFVPPPLQDEERESSYHIFPLRIRGITERERDHIIEHLTEKGICVNVHFIPMPMFTLFKNLGYSINDYPNSYRQYACEISLPIYPQLEEEQSKFVIDSVIHEVQYHLNETVTKEPHIESHRSLGDLKENRGILFT